ALTGVGVKSAAAGLLDRHRDRTPLAFEQPHGRPVGLAEHRLHHAAGEHGRVGSGPIDEPERGALHPRRERGKPADPAGDLRREPHEPQATREVRQAREPGEAAGPRERIEPGATQRPRQRTGRLALAEHLARPFHDPAEGHAGRTRGLARAAVEARLDVLARDRVIDDPATLLPYAYDASFWSLRSRRVPAAVAVPETTAEVVAIVKLANELGTPIVPRGAGTGQTGGAIAKEGGIVISF